MGEGLFDRAVWNLVVASVCYYGDIFKSILCQVSAIRNVVLDASFYTFCINRASFSFSPVYSRNNFFELVKLVLDFVSFQNFCHQFIVIHRTRVKKVLIKEITDF